MQLLRTKIDMLLIGPGRGNARPLGNVSIEGIVCRLGGLGGNVGTGAAHLWLVIQKREHTGKKLKGDPMSHVLLRGASRTRTAVS